MGKYSHLVSHLVIVHFRVTLAYFNLMTIYGKNSID